MCCFGVLTNVANITVLTSRELRQSSVNLLLTWLAVADLLTMLDYMPFSLHFYVLRPAALRFPQVRGGAYLWGGRAFMARALWGVVRGCGIC